MAQKLSKEKIKRVENLLLETNLTYNEIASTVGVSFSSVYRVKKDKNWIDESISLYKKVEVINLSILGIKQSTIGYVLKISRGSVQNILKEYRDGKKSFHS